MEKGLYDLIINEGIDKILDERNFQIIREELDPAVSHKYLSLYLFKLFEQLLSEPKKLKDDRGRSLLSKQIVLCNDILEILENNGYKDLESLKLTDNVARLLELADRDQGVLKKRPDTPLSYGALMTGTRLDPSMVSQLKNEILSSDKIDLLVSFIKWSGIRVIMNELQEFSQKSGKQLRIITTTYMGASDPKAIYFLSSLQNTELRISYDSHHTRLHAKAYLFHRNTGFSSAYIGSSNISMAALQDGLEWNVKISQYEQPYQWNKIQGTFDSYWNDSEFLTYKSSENDKQKLLKALSKEKYKDEKFGDQVFFELSPFGFQKEILDRIEAERVELHRTRHLIVAATGTGKTMIAAFDFKKWRSDFYDKNRQYPKLLFVAHRQEILKQSLATFKTVLKDFNFGDLLVGDDIPENYDNLFVSIQSLNSKNRRDKVLIHEYDYVVIDEFHHAAAPSYKNLLESLRCNSLIGLTATPERTDGFSVAEYFGNHISAEIRLSDAINRSLLVPFQYFGITDCVDYSNISWSRGGYNIDELNNLITGNDIRAQLVIEKTLSTVLDIKDVRGLGFCVSRQHAEYMADVFNKNNIPSSFLTSDSSQEIRSTIQKKLIQREINFIFVVDIYNEGVDIPQVDTILFLRPTESLTVFLQQLGRGLRISDNKSYLTVLDFIGLSHKKFRFDLRYRALTGYTGKKIEDEIEGNFPYLPSGCTIQFEKKSMEYVLENINKSLVQNKPQIIQSIASFEDDTGKSLSLSAFIDFHSMTLDDIYRRGCWSRLCQMACMRNDFDDKHEERLTKGLRRMLHVDDIEIITSMQAWLKEPFELSNLPIEKHRQFLMLHYSLWGDKDRSISLNDSFTRFNDNPVLREELTELLSILLNQIESRQFIYDNDNQIPLRIHARYTRDEILAGLGIWKLSNQPRMSEGVRYIKEDNIDIFFITLHKTEDHYSPTTMYEDYAINEKLFHWQSQSTTSVTSPTGNRYINGDSTVLLFVRENKKSPGGLAEPYYFLGPANYVSHSGSRPISIKWELEYSMPAHLVRQTRRMIAG